MGALTRAVVFLGLAASLLIQISPPAGVPKAAASHEDGHLIENGLLKRLIEGVNGAPSPPTLCSPELPSSTQTAAQRWRDTAGTGGGKGRYFLT